MSKSTDTRAKNAKAQEEIALWFETKKEAQELAERRNGRWQQKWGRKPKWFIQQDKKGWLVVHISKII